MRARGPCYRCLFPEPPPPGSVPSCAEGGVLGVLPGIIGTLQALEVDQAGARHRRAADRPAAAVRCARLRASASCTLQKDPDCAVCGESPTVTAPIDYDAFCQGPAQRAPADRTRRIGVREFARLRDQGAEVDLLDVRNPYEVEIAAIPGAICIPLDQLPARLGELDPSHRYVVTCHHGPRAERACHLLADAGFERLEVLKGGLDAWSVEVDPGVARYG